MSNTPRFLDQKADQFESTIKKNDYTVKDRKSYAKDKASFAKEKSNSVAKGKKGKKGKSKDFV